MESTQKATSFNFEHKPADKRMERMGLPVTPAKGGESWDFWSECSSQSP
jgi:hypothetical protein